VILGLTSLSATDDLIMATQGSGANIRDILDAETRPYDNSRISLQGPDLMLPPKKSPPLSSPLFSRIDLPNVFSTFPNGFCQRDAAVQPGLFANCPA